MRTSSLISLLPHVFLTKGLVLQMGNQKGNVNQKLLKKKKKLKQHFEQFVDPKLHFTLTVLVGSSMA